MEKIEHRAVIKFLTKEGVMPSKISERLRAVYGESAPSDYIVKYWAKQFKWGRESLEDDPRAGRPAEATDPDVVAKIENLVHENPRMSKKVLAAMLDISERSVYTILHEKLYMRKVCSRWIPRTLNKGQKEERVAAAHEFLELLQWNEEDTFDRIVTGDETWIHFYDPELKSQTMEWHKRGERASKIPRTQTTTNKVMASVFWDAKGILMVEFLPKNTTVTGHYYAQQMHRLRKAIKEKRHGLLARKVLLLHDNAPSHKSLLAQGAIKECGFEQLHHPPYSPDLAPSDYFLFPNTKKYLKGKRYESEEEIVNDIFNVWEEKDAKWFSAGIKALKHRYENVISVHGDYIE